MATSADSAIIGDEGTAPPVSPPPVVQPPATDPREPVVQPPVVIVPPVVRPPADEPPVIGPPVVKPPVTDPPPVVTPPLEPPPLGDLEPTCGGCQSCPCCNFGVPPVDVYENYTHRKLSNFTQEVWHRRGGSAVVSGEQDPFLAFLRANPDVLLLPGSLFAPPDPVTGNPMTFPYGHLVGFASGFLGTGTAGLAELLSFPAGTPTVCGLYVRPDFSFERYARPGFGTVAVAPRAGDARSFVVGCDPPSGNPASPSPGKRLKAAVGGYDVFPGYTFVVPECEVVCGPGHTTGGTLALPRPRSQYPHYLSRAMLFGGTTAATETPPQWDAREGPWYAPPNAVRYRPLSDYDAYFATAPVTESGVARRAVNFLADSAGPLDGDPFLDYPLGRALPAEVRAAVFGATSAPAIVLTGVPSPSGSLIPVSGPDESLPPAVTATLEVTTDKRTAGTLRLGLNGCDAGGPLWNYAGGGEVEVTLTVTVPKLYARFGTGFPEFRTTFALVHPGGVYKVRKLGYLLLSYFGRTNFTRWADLYLDWATTAPPFTCPDGTGTRRVYVGPGQRTQPYTQDVAAGNASAGGLGGGPRVGFDGGLFSGVGPYGQPYTVRLAGEVGVAVGFEVELL